jgi:hypothetical protein
VLCRDVKVHRRTTTPNPRLVAKPPTEAAIPPPSNQQHIDSRDSDVSLGHNGLSHRRIHFSSRFQNVATPELSMMKPNLE